MEDPAPGFVEADLVAHCGGTLSGSFVWSLVLTDIASGWTECVPLLVREARLVVDALDHLRGALPFPLRGIDTDNGSEFVNEVLVAFCREQGIELTRSRPYRKNDQAWVEQKNGAVVRRMVGYGRLEGVPAAEALARLYSAARLFVNVFQPSFKLAEKTRHGGRVRKRYPAPETPCARLLALDAIPVATKDRLRAVLGTVDPLALLDEIRAVQHHLAALAAGATVHPMPERDADLNGFPAEPRARMARRRGAADPSGSPETTPTLAHPAGSVRDELAPDRPVSGDRAASDREGALRPSLPGTARGVPPRPASDLAAPRPRLAASGRPSSPLRRSDDITPGCRSDSTGRLPRRRPSRTPRIDHGPRIRAPKRKARVRSF